MDNANRRGSARPRRHAPVQVASCQMGPRPKLTHSATPPNQAPALQISIVPRLSCILQPHHPHPTPQTRGLHHTLSRLHFLATKHHTQQAWEGHV
uniref:Uncharacterized protein n=1 Tax=Physcomitrium patens TaxID=3218 RepID=A0A2K1J9F7_PHYPA|nr:hypothetical protein PHYPA_021272 [Physcomitrium patens]